MPSSTAPTPYTPPRPARPLILTAGLADPLAALGVQADLATFAAFHCHGLSVPTALMLADTLKIEQIIPLEAELIADTARLLLEDMPVSALKIGLPATQENLVALAEIASDYSDLQLVLDPFCASLPQSGSASDDIIIGMRDLLIPQATLLLISARQLEQLAMTWRDPCHHDMMAQDAQWLIDHGCAHVLVSSVIEGQQSSIANTLFGEEGLLRHDTWPRLPGQFLGAGACLAAAITALLAHEVEISSAVLQAQLYCGHALAHASRIGMGKLIPARHLMPLDEAMATT